MAYNGRRGPNISEFIANLNAIPSAQEVQSSHPGYASVDLDDDLAMFTNTQFFDADFPSHDADVLPSAFEPHIEAPVMDALDFTQDFSFPNFDTFTAQSDNFSPDATPQSLLSAGLYPSASSASPSPATGEKRKPISSPETFEDASRVAAEEDKRRRNTAASARFRVKKKQREQALEKSAKEMNDKVQALVGRISQLETENRWLKNLITEKNESKEGVAALWKKYTAENNERKASERKDGVGTKV